MAVSISVSLNNIDISVRNVNYTKKILDLAYQNRNNLSKEQFLKIMEVTKGASKLWVTKYDNMIKDFNKIIDKNYKLGLQKGGINEKTTDIELIKMQNLYNNKADLILSHLKSGYAIIHKLREFVTGEEILYRILDKDSKNNYFEGIVGLEGILSITTLSKIKINEQEKEDYNRIINFKLQITKHLKNVKNSDIEELISFKTNLYNQLESLYLDMDKNFNRGHIYEMYTYLVNEKNFNPGKAIKNFSKPSPGILLEAARTNALRGAKGFKGGDAAIKYKNKIVDMQLKNISNAGAGLVNGLTIKRTMEELLKDKYNSLEGLQKFFLDEFTQDINQNDRIITHNLDRAVSNRVKNSIYDFFTRIT